jgi:hypothetical protein
MAAVNERKDVGPIFSQEIKVAKNDKTLLPLDGVLCGFILGNFFYYVHS